MAARVAEKIARCKAQILLSNPWWATLLLMLKTAPSELVPTMGTDGTSLHYNVEFTDSLTDRQCKGVLLHEVAHCALLHPYRRKWRDRMIWNIAADGACNGLLAADNIELPPGCIPGADLSKTAEELYEELDKTAIKIKVPMDVFAPGELGGDDEGGGKEDEGGNAEEQAKAALGAADDIMTEDKWRDVLASSRGLEPAGLSRAISEATDKKIDWRAELAEFVCATCKSDMHTWNLPSRRVKGMPGWKREPQSNVAIVVDTSGSISQEILAAFMAECRAVTSLAGVTAVLISADAAVHQVVEPGDDWPKELRGGGGTSFVPALKLAEERAVDAVIYLTDLYGDFPNDCRIPVLWAATSREKAPFGRTIYLNG
jgi:predicted metal-dependent peptidase